MSTIVGQSILALLMLIPLKLSSVDYYCDNGRDLNKPYTGAPLPPRCGYEQVLPVITGAPPNDYISALHCNNPGSLLCEVSELYQFTGVTYDLEVQLSRNMENYLLQGVTDSVYHENRIDGTHTYYGVIVWETDTTTGITHGVSQITEQ